MSLGFRSVSSSCVCLTISSRFPTFVYFQSKTHSVIIVFCHLLHFDYRFRWVCVPFHSIPFSLQRCNCSSNWKVVLSTDPLLQISAHWFNKRNVILCLKLCKLVLLSVGTTGRTFGSRIIGKLLLTLYIHLNKHYNKNHSNREQ